MYDALMYLTRVHLSPIGLFLAASGLNVLPLVAATTGGAQWIFWGDPDSWNRRGHPLLGWTGLRLLAIDLLVHWIPLAACVVWTLQGLPVEWGLSLTVLVAYALWARTFDRLAEIYDVRSGKGIVVCACSCAALFSVAAFGFQHGVA